MTYPEDDVEIISAKDGRVKYPCGCIEDVHQSCTTDGNVAENLRVLFRSHEGECEVARNLVKNYCRSYKYDSRSDEERWHDEDCGIR
jgi:hypothetical protein